MSYKCRTHLLQYMAAFLACVVFASCSQDELADNGQGTPLPVGQYPLELTAGGIQTMANRNSASAYSTVDGKWTGKEQIYVQIVSNQDASFVDEESIDWANIPPILYTVSTDGNMTLSDPTEQRYWQSNVEKLYIRAWCPGTRTDYNDIPLYNKTWQVSDNQTEENMASDDFLYAYTVLDFSSSGAGELVFKHLMAMVIINLEESEYLQGFTPEMVSVALTVSGPMAKWTLKGVFVDGGTHNLQSELALEENREVLVDKITPHRIEHPSEGKYASYKALLMPPNITVFPHYVQVNVNNTIYAWKIQNIQQFKGGNQYTFNITVDAKGLNVSVEKSIGWDPDGASGDGSVVLP